MSDGVIEVNNGDLKVLQADVSRIAERIDGMEKDQRAERQTMINMEKAIIKLSLLAEQNQDYAPTFSKAIDEFREDFETSQKNTNDRIAKLERILYMASGAFCVISFIYALVTPSIRTFFRIG